ncbi:MAG TPA: hypothetical protein VF218_16035 [Acidothermaceae bacterium]|jgi:hypothetical protein
MALSIAPILAAGSSRVNVRLHHAVVLVCAASAGVHAALVPDHLREGGPRLGGAFVVSAVATAVAAVVLRKPRRAVVAKAALAATALVLLGVAAAYVLSRTTGVPFLITDPEALDPVGAVTSAAEVLGGLASLFLLTRKEVE